MNRVPAQPIPKGIVNARGLVNELARESRIRIEAKNPYWQVTEIYCDPFVGAISYSRENIELIFEIFIGRVFDADAGQEIISELPIPVNFNFSLEPEPLVSIIGEIAVTPNSQKFEISNFLSNTMICALMSTQALIVTDSFTQDSMKKLNAGKLPQANSMWDLGELAEKLLK